MPEGAIPVLLASELKSVPDRYPSQIVLRQITARTFATHIKVFPPGKETFFILGRYFFNLGDAEADFHNRVGELEGPRSSRAENG